MDRRSAFSENGIDFLLHRAPSTNSLLKPSPNLRRSSRNQQSVSFASSYQSEKTGSENSEALYMAAPKQPRGSRRSLSSIGNRPGRCIDGSSDDKLSEHDSILADEQRDSLVDQAHEELTWKIIDQEICEWQYVCRTGRPFWWSPEAKYNRLSNFSYKSLSRGKDNSKGWLKEIDSSYLPEYTTKRRVASDSCINDPRNDDALAQMIAVQLLSSCFTLPMNTEATEPSPHYPTSPSLPDSRMISSLRMHMQYRYSPAFGHEARITSPVSKWSTIWDASSLYPSIASGGWRSPIIGHSKRTSRRRRVHQQRTFAEDAHTSLDERTSHRSSFPVVDHDNGSVLGDHRFRRDHLPYFAGKAELDGSATKSAISEEATNTELLSAAQRTNYSLQPVIRADPHPIYVQPVRELVVKRWKTFRRRFGGSLSSLSPDRKSEDCVSDSGVSSPTMSDDGRARRLRAHERGDIHDNSYKSTPRYNSEASTSPSICSLADGMVSPALISLDSTRVSQMYPLANRSVATAALALAESRSSSLEHHTERQITPSSDSLISPRLYGLRSPSPNNEMKKFLKSPPGLCTFPSRRHLARQRRASGLSEMHTPESMANEDLYLNDGSEASEGGDLSSSVDAMKILAPGPRASQSHNIPTALQEELVSVPLTLATSITSMKRSSTDVLSTSARRPRMTRMSTSGTQVFRPAEEGLEVDGLPVGPSKELWKGKRRARTYL